MIEAMHKYVFLIEEGGYEPFLKGIRALGVVHVQERIEGLTDQMQDQLAGQQQLQHIIDALEKREVEAGTSTLPSPERGFSLVEHYEKLTEKLDDSQQELARVDSEWQRWQPWGLFSGEAITALEQAGLYVHFYSCSPRKWNPEWTQKFPIGIINRGSSEVYFMWMAQHEDPPEAPGDASLWPYPEKGTLEWQEQRTALQKQITALEEQLDDMAATGLPALAAALHSLQDQYQFTGVLRQTRQEADDKLMVLEGFVPKSARQQLELWLDDGKIMYLRERATPDDAPPVRLRNSRYARLFEPISKLFALPDYAELDLTPFFAPFFMLFFGFCLGDAGYGLVIILGAVLYRFRGKEEMRPVLDLLIWLGLATVLFGALTGTFFGINLLENPIPGLESAREYMLDSNQLFQLALVLGVVQILFGLILKAVNQVRQYGWQYGIVPVGWMILLLSLLDIGLVELIAPVSTYTAYLGVGLILFFSDPKASIPVRVGKGLWELYGITGIFGDLLSYIRLFALGISSAILGYVVNNIGMEVSQGIPYVGPVLFVLFLVVGHAANLLIASLGAFVHPMRLTFVEFYKNAGFKGGGEKYNPLREHGKEEIN